MGRGGNELGGGIAAPSRGDSHPSSTTSGQSHTDRFETEWRDLGPWLDIAVILGNEDIDASEFASTFEEAGVLDNVDADALSMWCAQHKQDFDDVRRASKEHRKGLRSDEQMRAPAETAGRLLQEARTLFTRG